MTAPSARNKSENSNAVVPSAAPSLASGTKAVVAVIVVPCIVPLDVIAPEPIVPKPVLQYFYFHLRTTALDSAAAVPAVIPSNSSSSASVNTALPIPIDVVAVRVPPETIVPDTSKFAFTSTRVAFNSISSVALISSTVALGAPMF